VYRVVGILSFINVEEHKEKIIALANKEDSALVLSLRFVHMFDLDAVEALKTLLAHLVLKFNGKKHIYITGLSKSRIEMIPDKDWLRNMKEKGILLFDDVIEDEKKF